MGFVLGHTPWNKGLSKETDSRVADYAIKDSYALKGRKTGRSWNRGFTKETHPSVASQAEKMRGKLQTEEHRKKNSLGNMGKVPWNKGLTKETDERIAKVSEKLKGKETSLKTRLKQSESQKKVPHTLEWNKKISESVLATFQNGRPPNKGSLGRHRSEESIRKVLAHRIYNKPNKSEQRLLMLLEELFPGEFKYTGNGSIFIAHHCPDFINCNGKKDVIELFGDYWHGPSITGKTREEEEQSNINDYSKFGFRCLIIWESELKDIDKVKNKITNFCK